MKKKIIFRFRDNYVKKKTNFVNRRNKYFDLNYIYQQFSFIDDFKLNNYNFVSKNNFDNVFKHQFVETKFDDNFFLKLSSNNSRKV